MSMEIIVSKLTTIFRSTNGLNTKLDPARIYSSSKGVQDLAVAGDVDISDTGRLSRRKGYTKQVTGAFHSLFCDGGDCLVVSGTSLCLLNPDYTTTDLATVTAGARMSYAQVNDDIYYCNGHEKGIVRNGDVVAWEKGDYVGPDTDRVLDDPPVGTHVEGFNGRVYVAQGGALWFSEPYAFGAFNFEDNLFWFPSNIRMVRAVADGLYVSTSNDVYFLSGLDTDQPLQTKVANYPAIEYSESWFTGQAASYPDGGVSIAQGAGPRALMWLSDNGVCFGGPGGQFKNLTWEKIGTFPDGLTGSSLVYNGKFVGLIDP